jgi:hypothetical protein
MSKTLLGAAVVALGLAAPASAMPMSPVANSDSNITLAAYGCGVGWVRGPYGHCHRRGYVAPAVVVHPYVHPYYAHPYVRHCWWRAGVRICN